MRLHARVSCLFCSPSASVLFLVYTHHTHSHHWSPSKFYFCHTTVCFRLTQPFLLFPQDIYYFFLLLPKKIYHKILNIYKLNDDPNFLLVFIYIYVLCIVYTLARSFFKNNPFHWRLAYFVLYYFCYILAPNRYVVICVIMFVCVCVDFMHITSE